MDLFVPGTSDVGFSPFNAVDAARRLGVGVLERAVLDFASGEAVTHSVLVGGFGVGKSGVLRDAASSAASANLSVAWLERGPIGVSSYADFLVAVAKALRTVDGRRAEVDSWRRVFADDVAGLEHRVLGGGPLVIVVESLDQLLHQLRSADRPRLIALLDRVNGPLVLGSVHGPGLMGELGERLRFVEVGSLDGVDAGVDVALAVARARGSVGGGAGDSLLRGSADVPDVLLVNRLFWSLVGKYFVVAGGDVFALAEEELRARTAAHFDALLLTLAPSEQRVLLELAEAQVPLTVSELAHAIGVRNQAVQVAVGRLKDADWIRMYKAEPPADQRPTWCDIADPMLRWHLSPEAFLIRH